MRLFLSTRPQQPRSVTSSFVPCWLSIEAPASALSGGGDGTETTCISSLEAGMMTETCCFPVKSQRDHVTVNAALSASKQKILGFLSPCFFSGWQKGSSVPEKVHRGFVSGNTVTLVRQVLVLHRSPEARTGGLSEGSGLLIHRHGAARSSPRARLPPWAGPLWQRHLYHHSHPEHYGWSAQFISFINSTFRGFPLESRICLNTAKSQVMPSVTTDDRRGTRFGITADALAHHRCLCFHLLL